MKHKTSRYKYYNVMWPLVCQVYQVYTVHQVTTIL